MVYVLLFIAAFVILNNTSLGESLESYDSIYKTKGAKYDVDWQLIKAIAIVESDENPNAKGPTNDYGLMQVVYPQQLPAIPNWPPDSKEALFDPNYNVDIGTQILKWNIDAYGRQKGIAVYNSTSARYSGPYGPFPNEEYVDKVNKAFMKVQLEYSNGLL